MQVCGLRAIPHELLRNERKPATNQGYNTASAAPGNPRNGTCGTSKPLRWTGWGVKAPKPNQNGTYPLPNPVRCAHELLVCQYCAASKENKHHRNEGQSTREAWCKLHCALSDGDEAREHKKQNVPPQQQQHTEHTEASLHYPI